MISTSGAAASSSGTRAKQPSGSGGSGSPSGRPESTKPSQCWRTPRIARARSISARGVPLGRAEVDETEPVLAHAEDRAGAIHLGAPDLGDVLLDVLAVLQSGVE